MIKSVQILFFLFVIGAGCVTSCFVDFFSMVVLYRCCNRLDVSILAYHKRACIGQAFEGNKL